MSPRVKPENRKRKSRPLSIPAKEADLGYLAGIIDGEGNIQIYSDHVIVRVSTTSSELMMFLMEIYNSAHYQKSRSSNVVYLWYILRTADVYKFLRELLPHLRIKQEQAEKAFEFCEEKLIRASPHLCWEEDLIKFEKKEDLPL